LANLKTLRNRQSGDKQNHNDVETPPSDPNAMGPTMHAPYDATASGPEAGADMHNDHYPPPLPGRSNGFIGASRKSDDRRAGAAGRFDSYVK
jgi:hypothetical protein